MPLPCIVPVETPAFGCSSPLSWINILFLTFRNVTFLFESYISTSRKEVVNVVLGQSQLCGGFRAGPVFHHHRKNHVVSPESKGLAPLINTIRCPQHEDGLFIASWLYCQAGEYIKWTELDRELNLVELHDKPFWRHRICYQSIQTETDNNQCQADSLMPSNFSIVSMMMWWSGQEQRLQLSDAVWRLLLTSKTAVSELWWTLNPEWKSWVVLGLTLITFCRFLYKKVRLNIGL